MTITINGVVIPAPNTFKVTVLDIDDGDNTARAADGTLHRSRIATKRQIDMTWGILDWDKVAILLTAVASTFFTVNYPDPMTGSYVTKTFYAGDRPSPVAVDVNGKLKWNGISMSLTEQ